MLDKNKRISTETQLVGLRSLFQQFGVLHELQITQLKYWPYAVDTTLEDSEAEVDMENRIVSFAWKAKELPNINSKYVSRLKELLKMVRFLLGDDWQIQISYNGETIFSRDDCFPAAKPAKTTTKKTKRKRSRRR